MSLKEQWCDKIYYPLWRFFSNLRTEIKNFPHNLKNGFKWFGRGYHDRQWDHGFLMGLMEDKFKDMEKYWSNPKNFHIVEKERKICYKQIKTCYEALKRLNADNYHEMAGYDKWDKKWGDIEWTPFEDNDEFVEMGRDKIKTKKQKEQSNKEFGKICDKADKLRKKDLDTFFDTFKEKFGWWWD